MKEIKLEFIPTNIIEDSEAVFEYFQNLGDCLILEKSDFGLDGFLTLKIKSEEEITVEQLTKELSGFFRGRLLKISVN